MARASACARCPSACSRSRTRPCASSAAATRAAGAGRGRDGPGRGLRHRLDRPHLRLAGTDRGGLAPRAGGRGGARAPQHLSCYQLTIHPDTRFGAQAKHGQLAELPEDDQATLFELTHRFLADAGWPAYEVSNFARGPAHQSRHNRKYWDHTPYLGLGPSAHSLAVADGSAPARRWWNERGTPRWERRLAAGERPIEAQELLGPKELAAEALLLGLRTTAGIDLDALRARYGVDLLAANDTLVARLVDEGRIVVRAGAGGRPVAGADAVRDGRCRRPGRGVRPFATELRSSPDAVLQDGRRMRLAIDVEVQVPATPRHAEHGATR